MNILFFLTPKNEVAQVYDTDSVRQALEKMKNRTYSSIPMVRKRDGKYIGTLTEGDLLWYLKTMGNLSLRDTENISVMDVPRRWDNEAVSVEANMEDMLNKSMDQNFVPVIDGRMHFIGIIKRKDIMQYLLNRLFNAEDALKRSEQQDV